MVTILILTPNGSVSLGNHATSLVCFSSVEELVKHEKTKQDMTPLRALGSPGLLWERVQVGGRLTRWGFPPAPALNQSVATLTRGIQLNPVWGTHGMGCGERTHSKRCSHRFLTGPGDSCWLYVLGSA